MVSHPVDVPTRKRSWVDGGLLLILGLSLFLRLWGIGFGLPYEYHVDEVQYVRQAASMGSQGLEPVWWNNPPFYKYVFLAEYAGLFGLGRILGWYISVADFGGQHVVDPSRLYLLGRSTSALLGSLTVLLVYLLGKAVYNRRVGLLACWFLAVCFIHVRDSHYAVNDVAATFFVTVALLAGCRALTTSFYRWYVLTGVAIGVGFATKYTAALPLVPLAMAYLFSRWARANRPSIGRGVLAAASAALAAAVASPYFIITPGKVIADVYEALVMAGRSGFEGWEIDPSGGYVFYLKSLLWGMGAPLLLLGLLGLLMAAVRHTWEDLVILSIPLLTYLLMGRQQMYFARFILPAIPALLVLGASALDWLIFRLCRPDRAARVALLVTAAVVAFPSLAASLRSDYLLTQTDTRTLAKEWIESHLPEGSRLAVDWLVYAPPLSTTERTYANSTKTFSVLEAGGKGLSEHSLDWYREQGVDYLVASSFIYDIPLQASELDAQRRAFYGSLDRELTLICEFAPSANVRQPSFIFDEIYGPATSLWCRARPGPILRIYRVR